ncbi:metallophosphoesterase, partial [Elusimicrobiota bacterium]
PMGVWAVTGNHEFHRRRRKGRDYLRETGFKILHDAWGEAAPGLVVAGVDDLTRSRRSGRGPGQIDTALKGRPEGATILLSHTPWYAEQAAKAGVGLMLSGHTHGGQVWPFGYLVQRRYPLLAGRYEVNGMPVIVCRGTGTWGPRMRLWKRSEILRVTLRARSAQ